MEKEQRAMTSTTTLLLVHHVLSLNQILKSSTLHNLVIASKVTALAMEGMFYFADSLLHLQAVFRVAKKMPLWMYGSITQNCNC